MGDERARGPLQGPRDPLKRTRGPFKGPRVPLKGPRARGGYRLSGPPREGRKSDVSKRREDLLGQAFSAPSAAKRPQHLSAGLIFRGS